MTELLALITTIFIFLLPIIILYKLIVRIKRNKSKKIHYAASPKNGIVNTYHKVKLLTDNEKRNFQPILEVCQTYRLYLFSKVRLIDIIQTNQARNIAAVNKIIRKHVDFLLCDRAFMPVCVIEIDDYSHNTAEAKQRDAVKNEALEDAGIPMLRCRAINRFELESYLNSILGSAVIGKQAVPQIEDNSEVEIL